MCFCISLPNLSPVTLLVSSSGASSSLDSRDGGEGGSSGKGKGRHDKQCNTPPPANGGAGLWERWYTREGNGHEDIGDILCKAWNEEVSGTMGNNRKLAREQAERRGHVHQRGKQET